MPVNIKTQTLTIKSWRKQENRRKQIFKNRELFRYKTLSEINQRIESLNNCKHKSEIEFEKKIKSETDLNIVLLRNYPILNTYFIDFYEMTRRIAIEIDGSIHNEEDIKKKDKYKDALLKGQKIKIFRIKYPCFTGYSKLIEHLKTKREKGIPNISTDLST